MSGFDTKNKNEYGEYEVCFHTNDVGEYLAIQEFCRNLIDKKNRVKESTKPNDMSDAEWEDWEG